MAKFRFYIVDERMRKVYGTNDEAKAKEVSRDDDFFVIDAEKGHWLLDYTVGEYEGIGFVRED